MVMRAENWVGEYASTVGGGDIVLGGAIAGFCGFANAGDNVDVYYTIMDGANKETGIGTVVSGNLIRKTIHAVLLDGSYIKGGSPLQLSGDAQVYLTANASFMDQIQSIDEDLAQTIAQVAFLSQNAIIAGGPRDQQITEDIQNVSVVFVGSNPPLDPPDGKRWFDTTSGRTYIYYNDCDTKQWVEDNPQNNSVVDQSALIRSMADGSFGAFSHRNKIINGKMDVSQRGTSFSNAAHAAYTLDRWQTGYSTSAVTTVSQQADAPSGGEFRTSLRATVTTADTSIAAGNYYSLLQLLEGYNVRDLIGKPFTISFWVRSSKTGVHCIALTNSGADRTYVAEYTVDAADTWEYKKVTVPVGLIAAGTWDWATARGLGLNFVLAASNTYHTTAGAWQAGNFLATANQVNCLDTAGNVFAITGVQLEAGASATPFEHRPIGIELELCKRYYEVGSYSVSGTNAWTPSAGVYFSQKRTTPTIAELTVSGSTTMGAPTFSNVTNTFCKVSCAASAATNSFRTATISINAEL